jgi:DNA-binding Xre family transcriptional regulator
MIRVRLQEILSRHQIDAEQLAARAPGAAARAVSAIGAGEGEMTLETLDALLSAPRELTGSPLQPGDLLEYTTTPDAMTDEDRGWLEADLDDGEPHDWGDEGPPRGQPLAYEPDRGIVVQPRVPHVVE